MMTSCYGLRICKTYREIKLEFNFENRNAGNRQKRDNLNVIFRSSIRDMEKMA